MNNTAWTSSPNVKCALLVGIAALPAVIADLSAGHFGWMTLAVALLSALVTAKAFITSPDAQTPPKS